MTQLTHQLAFEGSPEVGYFTREDVDIIARQNDYDQKTATMVWARLHQIATGQFEERKIYLDPELGPCELGILDSESQFGHMTNVNGDTFRHIIEDGNNVFHKRARIGSVAIELSKTVIDTIIRS